MIFKTLDTHKDKNEKSKTLDRRRVWEGKWDYCKPNWGCMGIGGTT